MLTENYSGSTRMNRGAAMFVAVCSLFVGAAAQAQTTPSFTPLGDLPGDASFQSRAFGVSGDGSVAVGLSDGGNGVEGFRWDGSISGVGDVPLGIFDSRASATNADGSIVVGTGTNATGLEAFLWNTTTQTAVGLGSLNGGDSVGSGLSADGTVVAGSSDSALGLQAFRWQGGFTPLGDLAGGAFRSQAHAISGDGLTIVGDSDSANGTEAFVWQVGNPVMTALPDLAGGGIFSQALGTNTDGSLIAGQGESASGREAVLWVNGTPIGLGDLSGGLYESIAFDVSDNGTVVGSSNTAVGPEAFIGTASGGIVLLQTLLGNAGLAAQVAGWRLVEARSISNDGSTVAGWGINPNGHIEGFLATVPEPGTALLFGLGLMTLAMRRERTH